LLEIYYAENNIFSYLSFILDQNYLLYKKYVLPVGGLHDGSGILECPVNWFTYNLSPS